VRAPPAGVDPPGRAGRTEADAGLRRLPPSTSPTPSAVSSSTTCAAVRTSRARAARRRSAGWRARGAVRRAAPRTARRVQSVM
jgi:hypothetical protein